MSRPQVGHKVRFMAEVRRLRRLCSPTELAKLELDEALDPDPIGRLMLEEGLKFLEAVERLAKERGL